jgi:hypothetical protein
MKLTIPFYCLIILFLFNINLPVAHAFKLNKNRLTMAKDSCDSAGVYLTHQDYVNRKLTCKINPNKKGHKISFSMNHKEIKLVRPDTTAVYKEGTVYGYYQCGERYRYFKNAYYTITEKSPLVIYTITNGNFSGMTEVKYFYSMKSDTEIRSLTMSNLEEDFKSKPSFLTEVKNRFTFWSGLAATNENGKLLINELWGEYKYRNE